MTRQYALIATVNIRHRYFSSGVFETLRLEVDSDAQAQLRRLALIVKEFSGGFHLLCADPENLASVDDARPLRFTLIPTDPYVVNYTDIESRRGVVFTNNASTHPVQNGYALHAGEFASVEDYAPGTGDGSFFVQIDLSVSDLMGMYNGNEPVNYVVNFNTRSTIWRYFLAGDLIQKFDELQILNGNNRPAFEVVEIDGTMPGFSGLVFQSINKLPLLQRNDKSYRLVGRRTDGSGSEETILGALPSASPEILKTGGSEAGHRVMYSHIYIYP